MRFSWWRSVNHRTRKRKERGGKSRSEARDWEQQNGGIKRGRENENEEIEIKEEGKKRSGKQKWKQNE